MTMTMTTTGTKTRSLAIGVWLVMMSAAVPARAQETVTDIIAFLMTNQAVRTADIERDRNAADTARDTITRALLVNLTTVPIASIRNSARSNARPRASAGSSSSAR